MLDLHLQYALHTTSFEEQPLSDKTLSRFRKRCYDYETLHNVDLYHDCVNDLSSRIAKMMKLNGRIRRMDSMMIAANIRKLSRMELMYTCMAKMASYLKNQHPQMITEQLKHYTDAEDYNQFFYHHRDEDNDKKQQQLLNDCEELIRICDTGFEDVTEYDLFIRCVSEQTKVENGARRGYVANVEETVGENGSVVTDYEYEPNIYSDTQFLKDRLEELPKQEETKVLQCPAGNIPRSSCYVSNERIKSSFDRTQCEKCPYREQCKPQMRKRTAQIFIYKKSIIRAQLQKWITSKEFKDYSRLRNGIETIPSNIRRNYHLEKLPRGKQHGKFFFGCKITALNFRKLFRYRKGLGNYASNPLIA